MSLVCALIIDASDELDLFLFPCKKDRFWIKFWLERTWNKTTKKCTHTWLAKLREKMLDFRSVRRSDNHEEWTEFMRQSFETFVKKKMWAVSLCVSFLDQYGGNKTGTFSPLLFNFQLYRGLFRWWTKTHETEMLSSSVEGLVYF